MPAAGLWRLVDAPLRSLALLRRPVFLTYALCLFGAYLTMPFAQQLIPLLLKSHGVAQRNAAAGADAGQSSESRHARPVALALGRCGVKATMLLGLGAWAAELAVYCGRPPDGADAGRAADPGIVHYLLPGRGAGFRQSPVRRGRAGQHQGLIVLIVGIGLLAGNLLVGGVRELTADAL